MYIYIHTYIYVHVYVYILKYGNMDVNMYKIINWYMNMYIWQSISHVIGWLVDMFISYMYVCTCEICIWIYVPTCRNKYNWCTLKHLVLVRIKGLKKSPKIPGNTFSDALLKPLFQNFVTDKKKPRQLYFARTTDWRSSLPCVWWHKKPKARQSSLSSVLWVKVGSRDTL